MPRRQEIPISSLMVEVDLLSAWHLNYLKLPQMVVCRGGGTKTFVPEKKP